MKRFALFLLFCLTLTHCQRAGDKREVYCLILQARALVVRSLLAQSPAPIGDYRREISRVLASLERDDTLSKTKLTELYSAALHMNEAQEEYLRGLDHLSRSLKLREQSDDNAALGKGLVDGAVEGLQNQAKDDSSDGSALLRALQFTVTGAQSYTSEQERLKAIRERDHEGRLSSMNKKYEDAKSDFVAHMDNLAAAFSKDLKTSRKELALDSIFEDASFYAEQPPEKVMQAREQWAKERPNDPLVHAGTLADSAIRQKESLEACAKLATACNALTENVPDKRALNYLRYCILTNAAAALDSYFYVAYPYESPWGRARDEHALTAADYREKAAKLFSDSTGDDIARLAWEYYWGGKFDKALEYAEMAGQNPLYPKDDIFCLKMARLNSLAGQPDRSLEWLGTLLSRFGYNDIKLLLSDTDLEQVRKTKPDAFAALLKVSYSWNIDYGFFTDDVLLKNESRFPITNVHFQAHITSRDKEWNLDLRAPRIDAGESYKWENALTVPGSHVDEAKGELTCDQIVSDTP